jgi:hypothetical protein
MTFALTGKDPAQQSPPSPTSEAGLLSCRSGRLLHAVGDRIVPEAVEALQGLVHLLEFVGVDAADMSIEAT